MLFCSHQQLPCYLCLTSLLSLPPMFSLYLSVCICIVPQEGSSASMWLHTQRLLECDPAYSRLESHDTIFINYTFPQKNNNSSTQSNQNDTGHGSSAAVKMEPGLKKKSTDMLVSSAYRWMWAFPTAGATSCTPILKRVGPWNGPQGTLWTRTMGLTGNPQL